ncbi:hypothetical protein KBC89_03840 [Candidatus Woesebacteria bacterium]|nr:hypothetical protein [Candidatus Woesebacteria bacterium]
MTEQGLPEKELVVNFEPPELVEGPEDPTQVVLTRPEDPALLRALANKRKDYEARVQERSKDAGHQAPEAADLDIQYRILILDSLLSGDGSLSVDQAIELAQDTYGELHADEFNTAFGVVRNYVEKAGQGNEGGTGLSEFGSGKARNMAEAAPKIKSAAEQRAQARQERNGERKGKWGARFAKFKEAGKQAWEKVGQLKDTAGDKAKAAARETGQMIVDSPVVGKIDALQAGARAGVVELSAKLVETADRATTGAAEKIDATGRRVDAFKASTKAKAAEVAVAGLRGAVDAVRAGMDAVDKQLVKIDGAGEVAEDGPAPIVDRLDEKAQEQRQKQEAAQQKAGATKGVRGWLKRFMA